MFPVAQPPLLLDTNILLAYVRKGAFATRLEAAYNLEFSPRRTLISVVTEGELRSLALQFGWGEGKAQRMQAVLGWSERVSLDAPAVIQAYAEVDAYSKAMGVTMGKNDVWIAATAYVTGLRLLTTDKDFDHLDGIFLTRDWIHPHSGG